MNNIRTFYGSPTADGYYTTFDSSEVHRVDGGSEGGGGSSDFSTATVTFGSVNIMELPYIDGDSVVVGVNDATTYQVPIKTGGTLDVDIDGIPPTAFSTTGAVEVVAKGVMGATVSISGDCTIAIED